MPIFALSSSTIERKRPVLLRQHTHIHTGKEKGPRLRGTQLAETQVAGSLARQKKENNTKRTVHYNIHTIIIN